MSAWLKSKTCLCGTSASEIAHRCLRIACAFGSPRRTNTRNSTRATLVSRIAARSPEREAADRAGRVGADPLERQQRVVDRREAGRRSARPTRAQSREAAGAGCCSRAAATSRPRRPRRRCGERLERRILAEPLVILRQHAIDLRLLQHHLGDEDVVRVGRAAPGKIASVLAGTSRAACAGSVDGPAGGGREAADIRPL